MKVVAESDAPRNFKVFDPATEGEIASYPLLGCEEVNKAVARARKAFNSWCQSTFAERKRILLGAASVLAENAGKYADEIAAENGKTRFEALLADIFATADLMKFVAKHAEKFLKPVRVPGQLGLPFRKAYYYFRAKRGDRHHFSLELSIQPFRRADHPSHSRGKYGCSQALLPNNQKRHNR